MQSDVEACFVVQFCGTKKAYFPEPLQAEVPSYITITQIHKPQMMEIELLLKPLINWEIAGSKGERVAKGVSFGSSNAGKWVQNGSKGWGY